MKLTAVGVEVAKLLRTKVIVAGILACCAFTAFMTYNNYKFETLVVQSVGRVSAQLAANATIPCLSRPTPQHPNPQHPCTPAQRAHRAAQTQQRLHADQRRLEAMRTAATPGGAMIGTFGYLGSAVGVIFGIFLGMLAIDVELRGRAWRTLMTMQGQRWRIVTAKLTGAAGVVVVTAAAVWAVILLTWTILRGVDPLTDASPLSWSRLGLPNVAWLIIAGLIVPICFTALTIAAGLLTRSAIGGLGLVVAILIADRLLVVASPHLARFTPIGNLGILTSTLHQSVLSTTGGLFLELWPTREVTGPAAAGWITAATILAIGVTVALALADRQDVR